MNNQEYAKIYALLENLTPLELDCGSLCGVRCCQNTLEESVCGMRLFPGEMEFQKQLLLEQDDGFSFPSGHLVVCRGYCHRWNRPLSCRIFPLFPYMDISGRIQAIYDPRAWRVCPLVRYHQRVRLQPPFVRRVRQVGRILAADTTCREFLWEQSREIDEMNRFLRLETVRPPICRRNPGIR